MVEDPSVKEDDEDRISEEDTGVDVSSVRVSETESPTEVFSLIFDLWYLNFGLLPMPIISDAQFARE